MNVLMGLIAIVGLGILLILLLAKTVAFVGAAVLTAIPAVVTIWFVVFILTQMVRSLFR